MKLRAGLCASVVALLSLHAGIAAAARVQIKLRDVRGQPVPGAVVYLQGTVPGIVRETAPAVIDQRDKAFIPEVTVIQSGTEVRFPNSDSVAHHVYSFAQPNAFELPLYKGKTSPTVRFDKPGIVTLGCNIHDAMLGYIVIVDTPWFGISNEQGTVILGDIPPGAWELQAWSPRLNSLKPLHAASLSVAEKPIDQTVTLTARLSAVTGASSFAESDY